MQIDAVLEVEAGDPQIAIDFLVDNINLSKSRLKDLMSKGGIWRVTKDGQRERLRRAMTDILVGEQLEIFYDEELLSLKPMKAELLDDAGQYSVWSKPNGMPMTGNDWGDFNSFERAIELVLKGQRDVYWLSAFDYQASGILVLAHSRKAAAQLSEQFNPDGFQGASIHYRCDVEGNFDAEGVCDLSIDGEPAVTEFHKVRFDPRPNRSVVDAVPQTGRPDQVRQHLAMLGMPVVGDDDFGQESEEQGVLRLKVVDVRFECPLTKEPRHFE